MLSIQEIRERLKDRRLDIVSDKSGVSVSTIQRIRDGITTNPGVETAARLSDYLEGK